MSVFLLLEEDVEAIRLVPRKKEDSFIRERRVEGSEGKLTATRRRTVKRDAGQ
jgi:hypothetical protein